MKITNAKVFIDGNFIDGGIEFGEKIIHSGRDVSGPSDLDAHGGYIIPGLIDIHSHGAVNEDASDGKPEGIYAMSLYYAEGGVTSWCPTTMTLKEDDLTYAMRTIRDFKRPADGAKVAGVNLEGPFLSYEKRGSQNPENLCAPDADMFYRLNDESGGLVRIITVAPEEPGSLEFIRKVSSSCTVSVGHTSADYREALAAYEAGASHTTHLYNGMLPMHHRKPGVLVAAYEAKATVEIISDGFHIHPAVIRMTQRIFGDRLVLISDSLRCAGMPDGDYMLGGQPITMNGGKATLRGEDTLAGSSVHLMDALRLAVSFGIPFEAAVTAATYTPAKVIRMEDTIGSLKPGMSADFLILDSNRDLTAVFIDGKKIKDINKEML